MRLLSDEQLSEALCHQLRDVFPDLLHPDFPRSPYERLVPSQRWFPADETLRTTAYDKLLPPLVAKVREQVHAWRQNGYVGASATSISLLRWWFETEHLVENADG